MAFVVSLQREDQKDQHWERKRQSDGCRVLGMLCSRRVRTALLGGLVEAQQHGTGSLAGLLDSSHQPGSSSSGRALNWLGERFPGLQGRPGASFAMQCDHRDRRERWINTAGQTNGWVLQKMSRERGCMIHSGGQMLGG